MKNGKLNSHLILILGNFARLNCPIIVTLSIFIVFKSSYHSQIDSPRPRHKSTSLSGEVEKVSDEYRVKEKERALESLLFTKQGMQI